MNEESVVLDTNVFVAAGFNPDSDSARIIKAIEQGRIRMVWHEAMRRETRRILEQIPPLLWADFAGLFRGADRYRASLRADRLDFIPDPADRKFIALAEAAGAVLISNDDHLLEHRHETQVPILAPAEFQQRRGQNVPEVVPPLWSLWRWCASRHYYHSGRGCQGSWASFWVAMMCWSGWKRLFFAFRA